MKRVFDDILGEKTSGYIKYSQGRVYLFVSFIAFFLINIALSVFAIANIYIENMDLLVIVSSNMKWVLASLLLYVLGGKGVGAYRDTQTGISNSYREPNNFENNSYWGTSNYGMGMGMGPGGNHNGVHGDIYESDKSAPGEKSNMEMDDDSKFYMQGDEEVD